MSQFPKDATRPEPDELLVEIADYVCDFEVKSQLAFETARLCLLDSIACALRALKYPACTRLLGPVVRGSGWPQGTPVPGTAYRLDPVQAAFNIGCLIRWLDFNDTWLAAEWGHPSDNFGAILAAADYRSRRGGRGVAPVLMRDVLAGAIKAYEIQGVLALENAFNRVGLDHVLLVRVASTAVATRLLGGSRGQVIDAVSQAWLDGGTLRAYRHAPNAGSRKSWAAGDATSRAVRLALLSLAGEMGYPGELSTPNWGFCDVLFGGKPVVVARAFGSYVVENILFKISYPAEFHAQTAVEAAIALHPQVAPRLDDVKRVRIQTQEAAMRTIDKHGPLHHPEDRDHCLQYMTAIGLIFGRLDADHYEDATASDPRIDALRAKMEAVENRQFSIDYLDPEKRSIANSVQVFFRDGTSTNPVEVHFPIGHRFRRAEGVRLLMNKFEESVRARYGAVHAARISELGFDGGRLEAMPVNAFLDFLAVPAD